MRTLFVTALLSLPAVSAQTLPASPAPASPAPATPAATSAPTLQLTAPVGSSIELLSTTTIQMSMDSVQVSAAPGSKVSDARLNEARRGLGKLPTFPVQTLTGKAFYKVTGRDAAGNVTLLNTTVQTIPAAAGKAVSPTTMRITMKVAPDGKVTTMKMESDNPQINAALAKLTPEALNQMTDQSANSQFLYNAPLQAGQPQTRTATVDVQNLFGSIFSAVAGPQGQQLFNDARISPITATTTTTYRGLTAQGLHTIDTVTSFQPWSMNINIPDKQSSSGMTMNMALQKANASGQSFYRKDGLSAGGSMAQDMNIKMTMTMDGIQTTMMMHMKMNMTTKPR